VASLKKVKHTSKLKLKELKKDARCKSGGRYAGMQVCRVRSRKFR